MKFSKQWYTIDEILDAFGITDCEHITSNPKLTRLNGAQYDIVRQKAHDGTLIFTRQLILDAIDGLINKTSYCKTDNVCNIKDIEYEVGLISVATVHGEVDLPVGNTFGEKQRIRIPVKTKIKQI